MTIRIHCMTVLIRKSAVDRVYPGGLQAFREDYPRNAEDPDLLGITFMASGEALQFVDVLAAIGFEPGREVGIGDMFLGEVLPCEEVTFLPDGPGPLTGWRAAVVTPEGRLIQ